MLQMNECVVQIGAYHYKANYRWFAATMSEFLYKSLHNCKHTLRDNCTASQFASRRGWAFVNGQSSIVSISELSWIGHKYTSFSLSERVNKLSGRTYLALRTHHQIAYTFQSWNIYWGMAPNVPIQWSFRKVRICSQFLCRLWNLYVY